MEKSETFDELGASTTAVSTPPSAAQQQNHRMGQTLQGSAVDCLLIHGLSVERYRDIYNSVLQPSVRAALSSARKTDYVCQVLELKRSLWMQLSCPQLQETVMEDGRVEVTEILDLT